MESRNEGKWFLFLNFHGESECLEGAEYFTMRAEDKLGHVEVELQALNYTNRLKNVKDSAA